MLSLTLPTLYVPAEEFGYDREVLQDALYVPAEEFGYDREVLQDAYAWQIRGTIHIIPNFTITKVYLYL
jgi:hypothetical protein